MLFNKHEKGAEELRELTGSYYGNNKFNRIRTDVMLAQKELIKLVGAEVFDRANDHYWSDDYKLPDPSTEQKQNDQLVLLMQVPIAYKATFQYYQSNLVSHEDTGRKVKIDAENEKMAWEWMLDRDDDAQVKKGNQTTDMLLEWLESEKIAEWMQSPQRTLSRKLFVNSEQVFQDSYPIDASPRFFYTVLPWNKEVQENRIKKALGKEKYEALMAYHIALGTAGSSGSGSSIPGNGTEDLEELHMLVRKAIPLLVMSMAVRRLSVQVLPEGVQQQFKSGLQARGASTAALREMVEWQSRQLNQDAEDALDEVRKLLQRADPESSEYQLLPNNKEENKFFRT